MPDTLYIRSKNKTSISVSPIEVFCSTWCGDPIRGHEKNWI